MTTLQQRLDKLREGFEGQAPAEVLAIMHRATKDLGESGIMDGLPQVGSRLPEFDLQDSDGARVRSSELLERGPLVATFYRGRW